MGKIAIRDAEQRFTGSPLVLAAIAENERAWRGRLGDDEDEDEDE